MAPVCRGQMQLPGWLVSQRKMTKGQGHRRLKLPLARRRLRDCGRLACWTKSLPQRKDWWFIRSRYMQTRINLAKYPDDGPYDPLTIILQPYLSHFERDL